MNVITLSIGRNILKDESRERERMRKYAKHLTSFHVVVLTRKEHSFTSTIHEGNLHIYPTHSNSRLAMLVDAWKICRRTIRDLRGAQCIVSSQDPIVLGWFSWLLTCVSKARLHVQVHGDYLSREAQSEGFLKGKIRAMVALALLRRAPAVRVVSERIARSLVAQGVQREKIAVLPIRPELEEFLKTGVPFRSSPPYTFLFVGRLAPEKDIFRILEAFKSLHEAYAEIKLRIIGDGAERDIIAKYIKNHNLSEVVALVPWTESVPEEMSRADVLLLASKHEAFGLVLLEAMASGLPVVTTDVGCVGEIFKDSVHGIVVFENGNKSYRDAMERMIQDHDARKRFGQNGRETAYTIAQQSEEDYVRAWVSAVGKGTNGV